ncbi:MAG: CBS domain-containing protein [Rhodospirillales bacterium]|nr:CBS domain-containing protein [Rhodospirillales bacterium]MDH3792673.1 CBS domain-containing protein [Rhodospirillales bacterium]MDH3911902.1 CBS domain-containing protein [Rhodospirillales bacterium]MDH3919661.1 CBS domain-containing protein [Rhodospirillales bacterium]MDH3967807.1 CBS domain-containing protein [Rhodospirillales bacterium]
MLRKIIPDVIHDPQPVHLPAAAGVRAAARLMRDRNVGSVLIVEDGRLEGIFTERDMVHRVVAEGRDLDGTALGEVMTRDPDTVSPDTTALDALRRMQDGGYRHLPVVAAGRVVAVVSRRDFLGGEEARLDDETAIWERIG